MFFTREPGSHLPESSIICEEIRKQILENDNSLEDEAILFARSRYEHTKEIVKLLAEENTVVISDRYIVSSLAYQAYAQYLGKDMIYELNEPSLQLLKDNNIEIHCIKFNLSKEELEALDVNNLTPIEALNILVKEATQKNIKIVLISSFYEIKDT